MANSAAIPEDAPPFTDGRKSQRQRALIGAVIVLDNKMSTFECVVRNKSDEGFLIRMVDTRGVPDAFNLRVGIDEDQFRCEVVWRNTTDLGVRIVTDEKHEGTEAAKADDGPEALRELADKMAARFPHLAKRR
ncbi:MAG: hypothetical protein AAF590_04560 [Pseudomonadota bacterium]